MMSHQVHLKCVGIVRCVHKRGGDKNVIILNQSDTLAERRESFSSHQIRVIRVTSSKDEDRGTNSEQHLKLAVCDWGIMQPNKVFGSERLSKICHFIFIYPHKCLCDS